MPRVNMIPVSRSCAGSYLLIAAHTAFVAGLQIKGETTIDGLLLEWTFKDQSVQLQFFNMKV